MEAVKKQKITKKVPPEVLTSPGGFLLLFLAVIMEGLDLIFLPFVDQIIELPLEITFIILFKIVTQLPLSSCILPFLIERIPVISDILPTWLLRLFF
jgi:hypothetical protein